jgi:hypothetical protein
MKVFAKYIAYILGGFIVSGFVWFFIASVFFNWSFNQKDWVGSYYTDISDDKSISKSISYDTLAQCQTWGDKLVSEDSANPKAGYNCGRDCENTDEIIVSGARVKTYECQEVIAGNSPKLASQSTDFTSVKGEIIEVFTPTLNQVVTSPLEIAGKVKGSWSYEASFPLELYDEIGNLIVSYPATLQGDWMTEDYVLFTAVMYFEVPEGTETGKLMLKKDNPSGLSENDDSVELPIKFVKP